MSKSHTADSEVKRMKVQCVKIESYKVGSNPDEELTLYTFKGADQFCGDKNALHYVLHSDELVIKSANKNMYRVGIYYQLQLTAEYWDKADLTTSEVTT
jgi:hypothetical protein